MSRLLLRVKGPRAEELLGHALGIDVNWRQDAMELTIGRRELLGVWELILMTRHRHCFDRQNKVFALHAFIQRLVPRFCAPDYRKSLNKILLETLSKLRQYDPVVIRNFMCLWLLRASNGEDDFAAKQFTNRTFFCTDTGLLETCLDRLQEGDVIAISPDLPHRFVVRKRLGLSGAPHHYCVVELEDMTVDDQLSNEIHEAPLTEIYIH
ncbi:unnamed protein product [Clonostachys rosea]|uniref:Uncharacterized protein n=1 Tax=Bionectria ochroleuca TaxID=29856 RepID=A0ABY6U8H2_BIOOC|nr:unnamed protein product [Clonostachys rosea]